MTAPKDSEPLFNCGQAARPDRCPSSTANQNTGIVVALGGGFSRGFAHLGVLQVLDEEQIPVSAIVGTSIGGLLGAAYADGISLRDLCDLGREVRIRDFVRFQQMGRRGEGKDCLGRFVRDWFRAGRVEELRIPTSIVTTDISSGAPYIFTRGPIEAAVRATCAFPGLFKPVEYGGRQLADGCIVAPVPTSIAARTYGGCVLGVAVSSNLPQAANSTAGGKGVGSRFESSHPNDVEPSWSRHADILLEPEVQHIDWNDFSRVDEAFAIGAEAMRRALPSLRELLACRSMLVSPAAPAIRLESGLAL